MIDATTVTTSSGGYSLLIQGGILTAIVGGIFQAGRWSKGLGADVHEIREGLKKLGDRLEPLEQDYWRRRGYAEGIEESRRTPS